MITGTPIYNARTYLGEHLSQNDYYAEGEKVEGQWFGLGAESLGLKGTVDEKSFEDIRSNRNPQTGERLTERNVKNRRAFFDFQFSAPKDVSVLGVVGEDKRVIKAFHKSVESALEELERYASVRERRGEMAHSKESRRTGNIAAALFKHDSSRELDPQLHVHAVIANASIDPQAGSWKALETKDMMQASRYVRQAMYRELAKELHAMGYETHSHTPEGFSIKGVEHLRGRFEKRSRQKEAAIEHFVEKFGRDPSNQEIADLVKRTFEEECKKFAEETGRKPSPEEQERIRARTRTAKLAKISTEEVRNNQKSQLSTEEESALRDLIKKEKPPSPTLSIDSEEAIRTALDHCFERSSVVKDHEVLDAAFKLSDGFLKPSDLREALKARNDTLVKGGELTLSSIIEEEQKAVEGISRGLNTCLPLADPLELDSSLTEDQRQAMELLCSSKDKYMFLLGDAGTGKTYGLKSLRDAHVASGGEEFVALGPTSRARDVLKEDGFKEAQTVSRFLIDEKWQEGVKDRVIMVDEAGMLSVPQFSKLIKTAEKNGNRLLLVGDTKQHESVERGNAMRNVIDRLGVSMSVARLSKVRRQQSAEHREIAELLGKGELIKAIEKIEKLNLIEENSNEKELIAAAAKDYVESVKNDDPALVVCPVWDEINRFNEEARKLLRTEGILGNEEVSRKALQSKGWTEAQKLAWHNYKQGDFLAFHKKTQVAEKGEILSVLKKDGDGIIAQKKDGQIVKITRRQRLAFDVAESKKIKISVGDRIMIRSNDKKLKLNNGDVRTVQKITGDGTIQLKGGAILHPDFQQISYGHAVTSHKSQGSSIRKSILLMGKKSIGIANAQQWYVSNTRFKKSHRIYTSSKKSLIQNLRSRRNSYRELATEYLKRSGLEKEIRHRKKLKQKQQRKFRRRLKAKYLKIKRRLKNGRTQRAQRRSGIHASRHGQKSPHHRI